MRRPSTKMWKSSTKSLERNRINMKLSILISIGLSGMALSAVPGFDISHYQETPYNFAGAYSSGARFVIIKVSKHDHQSLSHTHLPR